MAAARKPFIRAKVPPVLIGDSFDYLDFIACVLSGTVAASKLIDTTRNGQGRLLLQYDDPNG